MTTLDQGGLDHGNWTALRYLYPDADIPVLPLAFVPSQSPAQQFALGAALAPLADEGVLVFGSGSITHNLRRVFAGGLRPREDQSEIPESRAFRDWMHERSTARDWEALFDYRRRAPHAVDMHPTDEHLLPWYVPAGAGGRDAAPSPARQRDAGQPGHGCVCVRGAGAAPAAGFDRLLRGGGRPARGPAVARASQLVLERHRRIAGQRRRRAAPGFEQLARRHVVERRVHAFNAYELLAHVVQH